MCIRLNLYSSSKFCYRDEVYNEIVEVHKMSSRLIGVASLTIKQGYNDPAHYI